MRVTQVITEEIAATFEREHYVVLKNVLTPQEVEAANADVSQTAVEKQLNETVTLRLAVNGGRPLRLSRCYTDRLLLVTMRSVF